jgi:hypothetical protein
MKFEIIEKMNDYVIINSEKDISKYLNNIFTNYEKIFYFTMDFVKEFIKIKYTNQLFYKNWSDFLKDVDRSECYVNDIHIKTNNLNELIEHFNDYKIKNDNINTILVLCSQSSMCLPFIIIQNNLSNGYHLSEIPNKYCIENNIDKSMIYKISIGKEELKITITKNLRIFCMDKLKTKDITIMIVQIYFECDLYNNSSYLKCKFINDIKRLKDF